MLADPRAKEFVSNFAGQWLQLRNLQSAIRVDELYPNFDDNLRQAFRTETTMFFDSIVRRIATSSTCSTPTTRSSTSGWRSTTASRASTAASSAAWSSAPSSTCAAVCSARAAC